MLRVISRAWIGIVIVIVAVVAGFGIWRVHGMFDEDRDEAPTASNQIIRKITPKHVLYEVFGDLGGTGMANYLDMYTKPNPVQLTSLPWSHLETTMNPSASPSVFAQVEGGSVGCRITVNGVVRAEHTATGHKAAVACTVLAA